MEMELRYLRAWLGKGDGEEKLILRMPYTLYQVLNMTFAMVARVLLTSICAIFHAT